MTETSKYDNRADVYQDGGHPQCLGGPPAHVTGWQGGSMKEIHISSKSCNGLKRLKMY